MREAAETRSYAAALSVLVVAEWLYLDWASRAPQPLSVNFVHAEWITLHDNPGFRGFVDFLRAELDRIGPAQEDQCRDFFQRAVANSPSSKPPTPTGPDIDVFDRVKAPSQRGTEGSNLASSSKESAANLPPATQLARLWDASPHPLFIRARSFWASGPKFPEPRPPSDRSHSSQQRRAVKYIRE
jgi:hypothetical protein